MKSVEGVKDILGIDPLVINKVMVNGCLILVQTTPEYQAAICPKSEK